MKSRPIIFRGDMVRAILAGTKTQTRRVVKETGLWEMDELDDGTPWPRFASYVDVEPECAPVPCPYGVPGDELWVRETFSGDWILSEDPPSKWPTDALLWYWADGNPERGDWTKPKSPIHMPRWASRLTLVVRSVRVERLSAITEADVRAERFPPEPRGAMGQTVRPGPQDCFLAAFRAMHKLPADADPWLWVVTFGVKP